MKISTTINCFEFVRCCFYESLADPRNLFEKDYKDSKTMEVDELYHKVLDKYGWAWRHPKYKSETEFCAMLKWAKDNNLTIEELRSI